MTHDPGPAFRALHQPGNPFILANVWDAASAKLLANAGAEALGTSSWAVAATLGVSDGEVTLDQALAHAECIVAATPLPVSGDFENGYADDPDKLADTVRLAAEAGLAGISIEDATIPDNTPYPFDLAVERIRAATAAARALPRDFVLVARADGIMVGSYDIDEALRRLIAFEAAGADCLYAPMTKTSADLRRICKTLNAPVNALAAGPYLQTTLAEFAEMGVARVSLGSTLARHALGAVADAADGMYSKGTFASMSSGIGFDALADS